MDETGTEALLTRRFALLTVAHFLQAMGFASMVLLPLYLDWLHASRTEIGLIMAAAAIGGLALRPFVGWALDHLGRRPTLVAGTLVASSAMALLALVDSIGPLVYALRVLFGIGIGATFSGYITVATDIIPEARRKEGLALFGISGLLPLVVVTLLRHSGITVPDLRWLIPVVGGGVFASLLFLLPIGESRRERSVQGNSVASTLRAVGHRDLWPVWTVTVVFATMIAVFMAFATVTASNRGVELSAGIWLTYGGGAIVIRLFGASWLDRLNPPLVIASALVVYAFSAWLCAWADTSMGFLLVGLLAGLAHGYCFPVLTAMVVDRSPESIRGSAVSCYTALWDGSALLFPPAFGVVADVWNDSTLFVAAGFFTLAGLLIWWPLERGLR